MLPARATTHPVMSALAALALVALSVAGVHAEPLAIDAQHEDLGDTPHLGKGPAEPRDPALLATCEQWARSNGVSLYSYHQRLIGNRVAFLSSCLRTADKGLVIVGTIGDDAPPKGGRKTAAFIARLDAGGKVLWRKELRKKGYATYEGMSAVEAPGGDIVMSAQAYFKPSMAGTAWILRFTAKGKQRWELILKGRGAPGTGLPDTYRLLSDDSILMEGHIYPTRADLEAERTFDWTGVIDARGKLVRAEIGKPQ